VAEQGQRGEERLADGGLPGAHDARHVVHRVGEGVGVGW
jgi:hypothetical protein